MGFGSGGEEEGEKRQIGRDCAYFSKQILILVTISERSSAQPLPPQVLQQGGEREGRRVDGGRDGVPQEETPEELRGQQVSNHIWKMVNSRLSNF